MFIHYYDIPTARTNVKLLGDFMSGKIVSLEAFKVQKSIERSVYDRSFLVRLENESIYCYSHVVFSPPLVFDLFAKMRLFIDLNQSFEDLDNMTYNFYGAFLTSRMGEDACRDDVLRFVAENNADIVAELPRFWDSPSVFPRVNSQLIVDIHGFSWVFLDNGEIKSRRVPFAFIEELAAEIKEGVWGKAEVTEGGN